MTKEKLIQLLKNPNLLDDKSIETLDGLIYEYPYFQSAHLLYLLNLKKNESSKYALRLPSSATYLAERKKLFCLLNEIDINKLEKGHDLHKSQPVKVLSPDILNSVPELEEILLIDDSKSVETEKPVVPEAVSTISNTDQGKAPELLELENTEPQVKNIEKEKVNSDKKEVDEVIGKKISQKADKQAGSDYFANDPGILENENKGIDLIDKFLIEKPSMPKLQNPKPDKNTNEEGHVDYSINSVEEKDDFITETLAKLYVEQGNYEKAIETYKKLSLKYSEKNTYFASQIEKIKKLT
jgi:tetratricopeptide (TPR) repeat protein